MAAAYAALMSLTHIIHDIQNHHSPPISLDTHQLQSLTHKVNFLLEFLEAYTSPFLDIDDEADPLEMRIADAAYAAEDVIESYIAGVTTTTHDQEETTSSSSSSSISSPGEGVSCINVYEDLHQVIEEMDLIEKVAVKIEAKKPEVRDRRQRKVSASSDDVSLSGAFPDDVVLEIMEKLVAGPPDRHVVPIAGMGGIGKTTLATNIYAQPLIKEHFDICVWATISQQFNTTVILCELVSQAIGKKKKEASERCGEEVGLELYKYLFGRRFLIVMDDIWSIDAWDEIQRFFPNNGNGSRILVTTRLMGLSFELNYNYMYVMKSLDKASSWDLFIKTVFGEGRCPFELEEIGKEIVENCRGLPLSIVVVGGLLRKVEQSERCWESIKSNLNSLVNLDNDKRCLRLLQMSYNHLPVYLKPCFLHMGVFKEDSKIRVSRLVKLWASEGFLKPMKDKNIEDIAWEFMVELLIRNLIVIGGWGSNSSIVKYLKIHDLLRDLCLRESQKCGFYHVVGEDNPGGLNRQRRVVVGASTSKQKVCDSLQSVSHTRSVICENEQVPLCGSFGLLRTLHAPDNLANPLVFQCTNLRYLYVEVDSMSSFLSSLNLIWSLHTLIVSCEVESNSSLEIWKMPQLRHIEFSGGHYLCISAPPREEGDDVVVMKNLETLKGVKNFKLGEEVVARIPNIIKMKLEYCGDDDDDDYCLSNTKFLGKLESLHISCDEKFSGCVDSSVHKLSFPYSLKSLNLEMNGDEFEWEEMLEKIASLPLLEKLILSGGCLKKGKWEVGECQFPNLKYLSLSGFSDLKHWMTQDSAIFPRLKMLHLIGLEELETIPREIGYTPTLTKIRLVFCCESVVMSAKEIVEEQMEFHGEDLPFYVVVILTYQNEAMESLAGPNFNVYSWL